MPDNKKPLVVHMRPGCRRTRFGAGKFENIVIEDGSEIYDVDLIAEILRAPGSIAIDSSVAQSAVDLGYIRAEDAAILGYQIKIGEDESGDPIYAENARDSKVVHVNEIPDFITYSAHALDDYAEANRIVFSRNWDHGDKAEACRQHALKEKAKSEAKREPVAPIRSEPDPICDGSEKRRRGRPRRE
jgi:hypothetical protein